MTFLPDGRLAFSDAVSPRRYGSYKLNDKTDPPEIDIVTPDDAREDKRPLLGIYRLERGDKVDTLTIYFARQQRPTRYEAPKGSGIGHWTLKQVKK